VAGGDQVGAQAGSRVVDGLVQGVAVRAEPLGENVDWDVVDEQGDGDPTLVRGATSIALRTAEARSAASA
jgi:hypothetical protein